MNIAEFARQSAIPLEVKKDGLQQRQNGDWVLRLVVQAADMDPRITNAAMGTRFQAALVEVGDDEMPKQRMDWRNVQPAAQAGIRCADEQFQRYLRAEHGKPVLTPEDAAEEIRKMCNIKSRSELSSNHKARALWHSIDSAYREWASL